MSKFTWDDYFKGRDRLYGRDLNKDIADNARITMERAEMLLERFGEHREITSGWRPRGINDATANAAQHSKHITAEAIDLCDPTGSLDQWCMKNLPILEEIGLWTEHFSKTPGWTHLQIVPPKSGNRVFYP